MTSLLKPYRCPPMTLSVAAAAQVRLIVWCKACQHQVEPDPAEIAARYGGYSVLDCARADGIFRECGSRKADFVVTRTERR
jgi:hypothetical protein